MYWEQDQPEARPVVDDIVDVMLAIRCKTLPADHADALWRQLRDALPWLPDTDGAALHSIHVAESGNGWQRPDTLLYPSRRTRLMIRVPREREAEVIALCGRRLDIDGHELNITAHTASRPLSMLSTLFSRYVVSTEGDDEDRFLHQIAAALQAMGITPRKMMCGREHLLNIDGTRLLTRSLMIADLEIEESLTLQRRGLGNYQHLGCGIFIPHKGIREVGSSDEHD